MDIIIAKELTKTYPHQAPALDNVSIAVAKGEFVGIVGPSGSGKTTLLNILSGMDTATSGAAYIDGQDITNMAGDELVMFRRQKIGCIFRDFNLIDSLTVRENIALPLALNKKTAAEIEEIVEGMMDFFGIEQLAHAMPHAICGEQKQRVSAVRAMVVNPVVCYADEPTGRLNSHAAANVMEMLTLMNSDNDTTILMATHDALVASYCTRVVFLLDGKITGEISRRGSRQDFLDEILDFQFGRRGLPPQDVEGDWEQLKVELY